MTKDAVALVVAANLRRRREALGMSLRALAERADVGEDYLSHIERGVKTPTLHTLAKIASGLGLGVDDLVRQAPMRKGSDSVTRRLESYIRGFGEEQKRDLLVVLSKLRTPEQIKGLRRLLRA